MQMPISETSDLTNKKVFLAPMEGITDTVYRDLAAKELNFDVICTEFVRLSGDHFNKKQVNTEIKKYKNKKLSVQLMGNNPELFAHSISVIEEMGADIIDLNLGCPSPKVTRKGCGAAMLEDHKLLVKVVSEMRKACTTTLSCKMRAGWDNSSDAVTIAKILENEGIDFLAVHPRTKMQKYDGSANISVIKDIKENLNIPVIGNGDIFELDDAINMIENTFCDGVMLGRGVLRNPFLISKVKQFFLRRQSIRFNAKDYVNFYKQLYDSMIESGKSVFSACGKMKEHMSSFKYQVKKTNDFWNEVKYANNGEEIIDIINRYEIIC